MAEQDLKISQLQPVPEGGLALDTLFAVVREGAVITEKATLEQLLALIGGGNEFHINSIDPIATNGKEKDVWLNTATGTLWKKQNGTWAKRYTIGSTGGGGAATFPEYTTTSAVVNMPAGTVLTGLTAVDAIMKIATAPFKPATISIASIDPVEKGANTAITVKYSITLNDEPAAGVTNRRITKTGVTGNWQTPTTNNGEYADTIAAQITYTYFADVTNGSAADSTISGSRTVYAYAPSFYDETSKTSVTEADVKAGTKQIWGPQGSRSITFYNNNQRVFFAEPKTNGIRARIMDQNGFNVTDGFTRTEVTYTLADGTTEVYYLYLKNDPAGNGAAFVYTFHTS